MRTLYANVNWHIGIEVNRSHFRLQGRASNTRVSQWVRTTRNECFLLPIGSTGIRTSRSHWKTATCGQSSIRSVRRWSSRKAEGKERVIQFRVSVIFDVVGACTVRCHSDEWRHVFVFSCICRGVHLNWKMQTSNVNCAYIGLHSRSEETTQYVDIYICNRVPPLAANF